MNRQKNEWAKIPKTPYESLSEKTPKFSTNMTNFTINLQKDNYWGLQKWYV